MKMQTNHSKYGRYGDQRGFTLVELVIALLVSLVIMAGVSSVFISHSRQYSQQDDIAAMQQNLRGILLVMPAEFRVAGCDPRRASVGEILTATETEFAFTADISSHSPSHPNEGDGKVDGNDETIAYRFERAAGQATGVLRRSLKSGGFQPLADNIEKLEFNYILDDNEAGTTAPTAKDLSRGKIRAVQISVLARAENPSSTPGFQHAGTFTTGSGKVWGAAGDPVPQDGHRRRLVVTTIQLRNMAY